MAGALDVEHEQLAPRDVNVWCMSRVRTNIEIEDTYLRTIMHRYGLRTKTEAVDFALRKAAWLPMSLEEARAMEGAHYIDDVETESPVVDL